MTIPTHAHLIRKAGRKAVGAYVAEHLEQEAVNAAKSEATRQEREVTPRFKKDGK